MGQYVNATAISLLNWDLKYGTGGIKIKDLSGNMVLNWEYYRSMAFGGLLTVITDYSGQPLLNGSGKTVYDDTDSFKKLMPLESDRAN